jgi:hypothetical protein
MRRAPRQRSESGGSSVGAKTLAAAWLAGVFRVMAVTARPLAPGQTRGLRTRACAPGIHQQGEPMEKKHGRGGLVAALVSAVLVAGCGGSDEASYDDLKAEADLLRAQAVAMVSTGPCSSDDQCTGLVFRYPFHTCDQHDEHTYAKASPQAAAAEGLADRQRSVAVEALKKAPPPDFACLAVVVPRPRHVCVANRCEQRPGWP